MFNNNVASSITEKVLRWTYELYKNSFNVQKLIQCKKTHLMYKNSFNV